MSQVRLIAALDFGTYGTGFGWAFASERDREPKHRQIHLFDEWAGQPTNYVKNLTSLLLDQDGEVVEWGFQALRTFRTESQRRPDLAYFHRFKMGLLDPGIPAALGADAARPPADLITAYLREFYRFALEKILLGSRVAEDEIAWCLTVPAIWRDRQRDEMRVCAERAGYPKDRSRLLIAVEPEVAALSCRHDSDAGSRYMVVDAGGGTVDITAYEVTGEGLAEIGYTSGGSHGATYVDEKFFRLLGDRLGPEVLKRAETLEPGALIAMRDEWERAKRGFDPARDQVTALPISYRLSKMIDPKARMRLAARQDGIDDEITLTRTEMIDLFDHVVGPILTLVDDQLARIGTPTIDSIVLVGGFAQSRYLQSELIRHCPDVPVIVPGKPSWAVLLGAVHYGLEPGTIVGRRSRFTYGFKIAMAFEPEKDSVEFRVVGSDNVSKCHNRFDVFVAADEIVAPGKVERRLYGPLFEDQREILLEVYVATDTNPRYVTDGSCERLCHLTVDLSDSVGRPNGEREVEVSLTFGGTEIEARAVDRRSKKEVTTTVSFERKA